MRPIVSLLVLASAAASSPAGAQMLVLGETPAASCYQHALSGRADRQALSDCDMALETYGELRRNIVATHVNRGIVLMRMDRNEEALASFDDAEDGGLRDISALALNRSSALIRLDRSLDAIAQTDLVIEAGDGHLAAAWFNRGVAFEALGDLEAAYDAYSRALDARPGWHMAERELARFTVRSGS